MCVYVCVCVRVRVRNVRSVFGESVCVYVCMYMCVCVFVLFDVGGEEWPHATEHADVTPGQCSS